MRIPTIVAVLLLGANAQAQLPLGGGVPLPTAPADPAVLFKNQCGTCHVVQSGGPPRPGPNLASVVGRKAGSVPGFKYSAAFGKGVFAWDEARLDAWLTNPQAMLPGTIMVYRQANPATRKALIDWLKEQH